MVAQFANFEAGTIASLGAGGLARHKRADIRDEHTEQGPRAGIAPVSLVDEGAALVAALEAIAKDKRRRAGERGRRPSGVYDVLLTGPARYDGLNGKPLSEEEELKWAAACIVWLKDAMPPGCIIANAYLHRDEAAPHVHVTIVPWCDETQRIDWRTVRARMAGRQPRAKLELKGMSGKGASKQAKAHARKLRAADRRAAGEEMKAILDAFHEQVSAPFGIERVKGGEGRRRRAVDRRIAAELEAKAAEKAVEEAKRVEAEAEAAAAAAEHNAAIAAEGLARMRDKAKAEERKAEVAAAATAVAVEGRTVAEDGLSAAQKTQREAENQATRDAEDRRREELAEQERARLELERIQDAIAVASAGRRGKRAKAGQAILDAKDAEIANVTKERDDEKASAEAAREALAKARSAYERVRSYNQSLHQDLATRDARVKELEDERPGLWRRAYRLGRRRGVLVTLARLARSHAYRKLEKDGLPSSRLRQSTEVLMQVLQKMLEALPGIRGRDRERRQAEIRERWDESWDRDRGGPGI